jgi:hypothetical protein
MLTQRDLRWNARVFAFCSRVALIPMTLQDDGVGRSGPGQGRMTTTIWKKRKIGFKLWQTVVAMQLVFMTFRTVKSVSGWDSAHADSGGAEAITQKIWDYLPIAIIMTHFNVVMFTYVF